MYYEYLNLEILNVLYIRSYQVSALYAFILLLLTLIKQLGGSISSGNSCEATLHILRIHGIWLKTCQGITWGIDSEVRATRNLAGNVCSFESAA